MYNNLNKKISKNKKVKSRKVKTIQRKKRIPIEKNIDPDSPFAVLQKLL